MHYELSVTSVDRIKRVVGHVLTYDERVIDATEGAEHLVGLDVRDLVAMCKDMQVEWTVTERLALAEQPKKKEKRNGRRR